MGIDESLDWVLIIAVLVVVTPIMMFLSIRLFQDGIGGFGYQREKAARASSSLAWYDEGERHNIREDEVTHTSLSYGDLLLMVAVGDEYQPETAQILVPGVEMIYFDKNFRINRSYYVTKLFEYIKGLDSAYGDSYNARFTLHKEFKSAAESSSRETSNWIINYIGDNVEDCEVCK